MIISGIYKITNNLNNKSYIGKSVDILNRWQEHINNSFNSNTNSYNYPLYQDIRLYSINNFSFSILESDIYEENKLFEKESYYIKLYNSIDNGYNQYKGHHQDEINLNKRRAWSETEINTMITLANQHYSYEEIGKILNRSQKSINTKMSRLQAGLRTNNPWTKEKEQLMLELRNKKIPQSEACKILGFSKEAVKKRWHDIYAEKEGAWNKWD